MLSNLENSKLGDVGCGELATNKLDHLRVLCLGINSTTLEDNNIGAKGCSALAKIPMPNLKNIYLDKYTLNKSGTALERRAFATFPKRSGKKSN